MVEMSAAAIGAMQANVKSFVVLDSTNAMPYQAVLSEWYY